MAKATAQVSFFFRVKKKDLQQARVMRGNSKGKDYCAEERERAREREKERELVVSPNPN